MTHLHRKLYLPEGLSLSAVSLREVGGKTLSEGTAGPPVLHCFRVRSDEAVVDMAGF